MTWSVRPRGNTRSRRCSLKTGGSALLVSARFSSPTHEIFASIVCSSALREAQVRDPNWWRVHILLGMTPGSARCGREESLALISPRSGTHSFSCHPRGRRLPDFVWGGDAHLDLLIRAPHLKQFNSFLGLPTCVASQTISNLSGESSSSLRKLHHGFKGGVEGSIVLGMMIHVAYSKMRPFFFFRCKHTSISSV